MVNNAENRIIFLVSQFSPLKGGAERQAEKLGNILVHKGCNIRVITGLWDRTWQKTETIGSLAVKRCFIPWIKLKQKNRYKYLGGSFLSIFSFFFYLIKIRNTFDFIHVHLCGDHAVSAALMVRLFKKKAIVKLASYGNRIDLKRLKSKFLIGNLLYKFVKKNLNGFIATSSAIKQDLLMHRVPENLILSIPNGVVLPDLKQKNNPSLIKKLQLNPDIKYITYVGTLSEVKNLFFLIKAFAWVSKNISCNLLIIGNGILMDKLQAKVREYRLTERILFIGQTNNVMEYLLCSFAFVLVSKIEGFSNAVLEAMSAACPCIVSNVGGNKDLIQDNVNGYLIDPEKNETLVSAFNKICHQPAQAENFGKKARQKVEKMYDIYKIADQYLQLYKNIH